MQANHGLNERPSQNFIDVLQKNQTYADSVEQIIGGE
jgi:hypothetical protein